MCRDFDASRVVEREKLEQLVRAGNRAPQGGNMPVREFIIVDDPRLVQLAKSVTPSFLANAPAIIIVITDLTKAAEVMGTQGRDVLSLLDAGATAENMALRAIELGLGVSFVRSATTNSLMHVLKIPDRFRIDILIGVGYPNPARKPSGIKGQPPVIHLNTYGSGA
jgi:nitroreductase